MPIDNEEVNNFGQDLVALIDQYKAKISNAEVLGVLKLIADDISDKTRHFPRGPHELS